MIAIVDYGAGNLQSVKNALDFIGAESVVTADAAIIESADGVILPGVGSFGDAMNSMKASGLVEAVKASAVSGKPFLGICLGLQLLFESSEESPGVEGLCVLKGKILKIPDAGLKVPHMGWNSLEIKKTEGIFKDTPQNTYVYFVHSYYLAAANEAEVAAKTFYGVSIDAAVSAGNLFGVQFHPEKSGDLGLQMLRNFVALKKGDK
jgi:glutamine amidotransferase